MKQTKTDIFIEMGYVNTGKEELRNCDAYLIDWRSLISLTRS